MKRLAFPMAVALLSAAALVAVPFSTALAQSESGGVDKRASNTRAARNAEKNKSKQQVAENPYPNATRAEPEVKVSSKLGRKIDKAVKALYDEKYDEAEQVFGEVLADADARAGAEGIVSATTMSPRCSNTPASRWISTRCPMPRTSVRCCSTQTRA